MRIKRDYVIQEIADEYVVVPVGDEANRIHGVIRLNQTGAFLWNHLTQNELSVDELAVLIIDEFGIDERKAVEDVMDFIEHLQMIGCIE